ncbi:MAG: hypothetical protein WCG26_12075 [Chloroflexales bacterium]
MSNPEGDLRLLLRSLAPVTALVGTRIYMANDPPPGYAPISIVGAETLTGTALLFTSRGGPPNATRVYTQITYTARCIAATEPDARALDAALRVLEGRGYGCVRAITLAVRGQHVPSPDVGWHTYLSTWNAIAVTA